MSHICGGSSLNIAASGAADGTIGCFQQSRYPLDCKIYMKSALGSPVLYHCVPERMYSQFLAGMPLMQRGWAVQERLLPSRTLHFTTTQVFWECHEKVACETFAEEFPPTIASAEFVDYFSKGPIVRASWMFIVEHYSRCQLTHSADKLVAIAGLARCIQLQTHDQYVAGLWRTDLEYDLCWNTVDPPPFPRATNWRAPTWSWVSLDCPVTRVDRFYDRTPQDKPILVSRVINVDLQYAGEDIFGQLVSARLCLSCPGLIRVTSRAEYSLLDESNRRKSMLLSADECWVYPDQKCEKSEMMEEVIALPIYRIDDGNIIQGLLLEPTKNMRAEYRRIGQFHFFSPEYFEAVTNASTKCDGFIKDPELVELQTDESGRTHRIIILI